MRNNNGASIRRLSNRSLRNNRMRNLFAILAIILTGILFTATFSRRGHAGGTGAYHAGGRREISRRAEGGDEGTV